MAGVSLQYTDQVKDCLYQYFSIEKFIYLLQNKCVLVSNNEELKAIKRGAEIRDKLLAIDFSVKTISSSKLQDMSVSLDLQSTRLGAKVQASQMG